MTPIVIPTIKPPNTTRLTIEKIKTIADPAYSFPGRYISAAPTIIRIDVINPMIGIHEIHIIGKIASSIASHGIKKNIIADIGGQNNIEIIVVISIIAPAASETPNPAVALGNIGVPH